jgi:hypothetical protein
MGKRNRVELEGSGKKDSVSPPTKMTGRRSTSVTRSDEIIAKLDAMEARFLALEEKVDKLTKALDEMEAIRAEVVTMKGSFTEVHEGVKRMEIEAKKRCLLVRGLPFKTKNKFESRQQTREALSGFFQRLDMVPHLVDYQRLGGQRDNEDGSKVSVRIQFVDMDQKFDLFEKLKAKGKDLDDITILTDYPVFQLQEFKKLSGLAYNIRKDHPGTRTRVVPKGLGLVLQKRTNGTDKWTAVSAVLGSPSSSSLELE